MTTPYDRHPDRYIQRYERVDPGALHDAWAPLLKGTPMLALDVGAGSGRDAAWLAAQGHEVVAVEPSDAMRARAQELHPSPSIQWIDDALPGLSAVHELDYRFDLVLVSAVWMHVPPPKRERAFRKLAGLLRPSGLLVITLRHGPSPDEREMHPVSEQGIRHLARQHALEVVQSRASSDRLGRGGVEWTTVVLRLPDDGTGALPLLRHVLINDSMSSTYKPALLRTVLRIADGARGVVLRKTDSHVEIPFGLVALYWIRQFKRLVLERGFRQQPTSNGGLGFDGEHFQALRDISTYDLRLGSRFTGPAARSVMGALRAARNTIRKMPAHYITYPGGSDPIFTTEINRMHLRDTVRLDLDFLQFMGTFRVPREMWEAMTRYACWLEPAILDRWSRLMETYDRDEGRNEPMDTYLSALKWLGADRSTRDVRDLVRSRQGQGEVRCVWTGQPLKGRFAVDHCFPFAHWPNNDLWNLLPATPQVNSRKSDRLPSAALLQEAAPRIRDWWNVGYGTSEHRDRFLQEARAALPPALGDTPDLDAIWTGVQHQRIRLRTDQQIEEWSP
jgi:SAM-dependent methyltransferase